MANPLAQRVRQQRFESVAQEASIGLLLAAGHVRQRLFEVCAGFGITPDQYNVLRILRGVHPEGHPRYEISDRLIERAPDVTRLLDRLERAGFVERYRSPGDRRLSLTRISRAGLDLLAQMQGPILGVHEAFMAPLTEAERADLARLCAALCTLP